MLHQLDYIWQDIERHNSLNSFIGEIVVDNKNFKTINNKTQLSPQDAKWDLIREKLAEEEYKPSKSVISRTEDGIRDTLKNQLENNNPGSNVDIQYATWDGAGVLIDIHMKKNDGKVWIYELKKDSAGPLDVYQLIMYWDGKVKAGESPEQAFLVASDCPTSVKIMIDYWNTRKDASNSLYKLIFKKIDDLMPPR
jgi:hypothetical protein